MSSKTLQMKIMMMFKDTPIYGRVMLIQACIHACIMVFTCIILELVCGVPAFAYVIAVVLIVALSYALWKLLIFLSNTLWTLAFAAPVKFIYWVYQKLK